jgi:hypothetical protein
MLYDPDLQPDEGSFRLDFPTVRWSSSQHEGMT